MRFLWLVFIFTSCEMIYSDYTDIVENNIFNPVNTVALYDYTVLSSITKDGGTGEVSRWNDLLGSGHDLIQSSATKYPIYSADGITFDGVNDFLRCASFTTNQPITVYLIAKQITWDTKIIFDSYTKSTVKLEQVDITPEIRATAGSTAMEHNNCWTIDQFNIISIVFNGANSKLRINKWREYTFDCGTKNSDGFTLGANGNGTASWSNICVKGAIYRNVADNDFTRDYMIDYLADKYSIDLDADKRVPMVAIVCDDSYAEAYSVVYPIFQEYEEKGNFSISTDWVNDVGAVTSAQLLTMESAGHEIIAHSCSHPETWEGLTEEEIDHEVIDCKTALEGWGLTIYNWAFPGPSYSEAVEAVVNEHYEAGLRAGTQLVGTVYLPLNMGAIYRAGLVYCDTQEITDLIDTCFDNDGSSILIFYTHPSPFGEVEEAKFRQVCEYVAEKGGRLYTIKEMIDKVKTYTIWWEQ